MIGTSRLAFAPVTTGAGWWSPRKISTMSSSPYFCTYEISASSEYSMDLMYEARSLSGSPMIDPGGPPSWLAGSL